MKVAIQPAVKNDGFIQLILVKFNVMGGKSVFQSGLGHD